jgi:parallel beta-helix repeat protein
VRIGASLLVIVTLFVMPVAAREAKLFRVPGEYSMIAEALAAAPDGATIEVAPGEYAEKLVIERPVVLRGAVGDVIITGQENQPVIKIIDTHDVTIRGLIVQGGQYGILVIHSQGIVIRGNIIRNNDLVGIKVRMGSADIIGNAVLDTQPPYGKGIHITNSMDWPRSSIRGNTVTGNAMSGITTNMAMVTIVDNEVRDNGQRGIAVTEMSEAVVADNWVEANAENGIYVSDQSTAIVCNNTVTHSQLPTISDVARYGNGITVDFHSQAELHNNIIVDNANRGVAVLDSSQVDVNDNVIHSNGSDAVWMDDTSTGQRNVDLPQSCE